MSDVFRLVYRIHASATPVAERAESLLLEQTVELPRKALHTDFVRQNLVGRVVSLQTLEDGDSLATLEQPVLAGAGDPAQVLNVLFGNSSLQPDVELKDVELPASLFPESKPRFGIPGWRKLQGIEGRALTSSALKPMGLTVAETAALCGAFSRAGIDVIKDDHGLANHAFCPFEARVRACLQETEKAAQTTGRRSWYVPNLIGTPSTVLAQARLAEELGAPALMVSPMLLGLPFLTELRASVSVPLLAHPAFGGAQRISPVALLGKLFPRFGADAVIFPNLGGRFSYSKATCGSLAASLRHPSGDVAPVWPVPAGGMKTENVPAMLEFFGRDTMLLIGGSLLEAETFGILEDRSRLFVEAVHHFPYVS